MPYPSNDPPEHLDLNSETSEDASYRAAGSELRAFIERIEHVRGEIAELKTDEKEIFSEAKARGYNTTVLREVLKRRQQDPDSVAEKEAIFDMYWEAILEA